MLLFMAEHIWKTIHTACQDDGTLGYWTSSFAGSSEAWNVNYDGRLVTMPVSNSSLRGVRPVITVDKLLLR